VSDADNLELKKKARRRLVGAAALALFAAIVLPMTMDQEPPSYPNDIQVALPKRGAQAHPDAPAVEVAPGVVPDAEAEFNTPAVQAPATPPVSSPGSVPPSHPAPVTVSAPTSTSASGDKPVLSATALKQQNEDRARAEREAEAARVRRLLDGKASEAVESYVVQIGAFGEPAKAVTIVSELKQQGFSAYTEKVGNVTRVRIGPVADRRTGEQIVARLKAQGYGSAVVAPR
jgi:DedD protein